MTEQPKIWRDMTPAEKGALLLAYHEGKAIELQIDEGDWVKVLPSWTPYAAYRVKPEPTVETVAMHGGKYSYTLWNFENDLHKKSWHTHRITFNLIDGQPDCASIRMKSL
jgi:hypothetical protein